MSIQTLGQIVAKTAPLLGGVLAGQAGVAVDS